MLPLFPILFVVIAYLLSSLRVVAEYERLVVFFLGRLAGQRGPGLTFVFWPFHTVTRVSLKTTTMVIPSQEIVTRDSVTVKIAAACFWRVKDPTKAVLKISNYVAAVLQVAQTGLRSSLSKNNLDDVLAKQDELAQNLKLYIDKQTEEWGIEVEAVELKDIELPDNLRRALAREAEAERERRAKIIAARGEDEAADILVSAATKLSAQPAAIQLRWLETLLAISAENNSTIIPLPVDMMGTVIGRALTKT